MPADDRPRQPALSWLGTENRVSIAFDPRTALPLGASTFYILLALAAGERHGYAIAKEVEEQTAGTVRLGPGTLYRLIKQLTADGWIAEIDAPGDDHERRRTYRLTPRGRQIARAEAERLDALVGVARTRRLLPA